MGIYCPHDGQIGSIHEVSSSAALPSAVEAIIDGMHLQFTLDDADDPAKLVMTAHMQGDVVGSFHVASAERAFLALPGARTIATPAACIIAIDLFLFLTDWGARDGVVDALMEYAH